MDFLPSTTQFVVMGCVLVVFGICVCVFLEMGLLARVGMCDFYLFIFGIGGGLGRRD
jgi:hypothetical protein